MSSPSPQPLPEHSVPAHPDPPQPQAPSVVPPQDPSTDPSPDARSDLIEQIFQKVEEETERRALEEQREEERSRPSTANRPSPTGTTATGSTAAAAAATAAAGRDPTRDRRRGSISVSRFGQTADLSAGTCDNPSKLPSRKNSLIINAGTNGAFYKAQKFTGSADSFASDTELPQQEDAHDEEQVTQMETIAGRVSLGKAMGRTIARRLSRARTRSRDILTVPSGLVIGVSVEEATTEAEHHGDAAANGAAPLVPIGTTIVDALETIDDQHAQPAPSAPPTMSAFPDKEKDLKRLSAVTWMARAKDLTRRLKRRSMAVLPQHSSP
ncbi:hypothetical protein C8Q80DRAFT_1267815 [Daedaleopsis nitida]|nr:hypothetical protein C8Q80DRAFT_1267815 [Daedaleopsis nitida]